MAVVSTVIFCGAVRAMGFSTLAMKEMVDVSGEVEEGTSSMK